MIVYDISQPITPQLAVYPGDAPVRIKQTLFMSRGAACNLSEMSMSLHAGTHADAPFHCNDAGVGVDGIPLSVLIGPARLVTLRVADCISVDDLQALDLRGVTRLLVRTRRGAVTLDQFDGCLVGFAPAAAAWLVQHGLRLIGTDAASVDPVGSADLPAHQAFGRGAGVVILENLYLQDVPDGDYELIALPLRVAGADAAPARVVLRRLMGSGE